MTKIYFAGSIRGGRQLAGRYRELIEMLFNFGHVYTGHVGDEDAIMRDDELSDRDIHNRDLDWIRETDLLVAEVSVPSLGVGYEIATAIALGKPVLCLYDNGSVHRLSAMISGSENLELKSYNHPSEVPGILEKFLKGIQ